MKAGCQNGRKVQSLPNSCLATPLWMLQGRQMVPIQLESIVMWRSCWLGTPDRYPVQSWEEDILYWLGFSFFMKRSNVCDRLRFCVHHLVVYQDYSPPPSMRDPHDADSLPTAPKWVVNKQWYSAQYLYTTYEWIWQQSDKGTKRILTIV